MCTSLECQAHFGQKGPPTERQSRRNAVFCVVALKVARGSPKERRSAPARCLKALPEIGRIFQRISQKTNLQKTMCFTRRNGRRAKSGGLRARNGGRVFSKNVAPLQRQGPAGTKATPRSVQGVPEECQASVRGVSGEYNVGVSCPVKGKALGQQAVNG